MNIKNIYKSQSCVLQYVYKYVQNILYGCTNCIFFLISKKIKCNIENLASFQKLVY